SVARIEGGEDAADAQREEAALVHDRRGLGTAAVRNRTRIDGIRRRVPRPPEGLARMQIERARRCRLAFAREEEHGFAGDDRARLSGAHLLTPALDERRRPRAWCPGGGR